MGALGDSGVAAFGIHRQKPFLLAAALCVALAWGCDRSPEPKEAGQKSKPAVTKSKPKSESKPKTKPEPARHESTLSPPSKELPALKASPAARIVAVGDLHGDIDATRKVLRLAGVLDEDGHWAGGNTVLVQTGDQVDRGAYERQIIELLRRLAEEAEEAGGRVHQLNGNHEVMNVTGDFRYVTPGALGSFAGLEPSSPRAAKVDGPLRSRAEAFFPGGAIALRLAERPVVLIVGDNLFAHGGVLPEHVVYGLDRLNRETSLWMRGERRNPPRPVVDPEGPLWTRAYAPGRVPKGVCKRLEKVLERLDVDRLVVGHSVQKSGIVSGCDERVFRIDVGLAAHYGDGPVQALEIRGGKTNILTAEW